MEKVINIGVVTCFQKNYMNIMFSDARAKLESCCVAIEKTRQDFELLESKKQERLQRRAEIENKIEEDKQKFRT